MPAFRADLIVVTLALNHFNSRARRIQHNMDAILAIQDLVYDLEDDELRGDELIEGSDGEGGESGNDSNDSESGHPVVRLSAAMDVPRSPTPPMEESLLPPPRQLLSAERRHEIIRRVSKRCLSAGLIPAEVCFF